MNFTFTIIIVKHKQHGGHLYQKYKLDQIINKISLFLKQSRFQKQKDRIYNTKEYHNFKKSSGTII